MKNIGKKRRILIALAFLWTSVSCANPISMPPPSMQQDLKSKAQQTRTQQKGKTGMNEKHKVISDVLDFSDEQYFHINEEDKSAYEVAIAKALRGDAIFSDAEPEIVYAVSAPKNVNGKNHSQLPIIFVSHTSTLRDWQVSEVLNTHIILVNRSSGQVKVARFSKKTPSGKRLMVPPPSQSKAKPSEARGKDIGTGIKIIDLKDFFDIPNINDAYSVMVISYDHGSNIEHFNITGYPSFIDADAQTSKVNSEAKVPSPFVSNIIATDTTETKLAVTTEDAKTHSLNCQISLPSEELSLIHADKTLLPASLIFMKLDQEEPLQIDFYVDVSTGNIQQLNLQWQVDIQQGLSLQHAQEQGLDLSSEELQQILNGNWQVYLVVGSFLSQALPVQF
ncbi:hypothetical protein [Agarilytica rhodophyticola]|uniref:hypothetical protein n=1 Tax=Agarilytica rhodophyticola TaxID=1737490 RepID=UPI000B3419AD|nr:hypothetical protein [Agarilytica rhodophyticola]